MKKFCTMVLLADSSTMRLRPTLSRAARTARPQSRLVDQSRGQAAAQPCGPTRGALPQSNALRRGVPPSRTWPAFRTDHSKSRSRARSGCRVSGHRRAFSRAVGKAGCQSSVRCHSS